MSRRRRLRVVSALVTLGVAGAWFVFLRPPLLGGATSYVLVAGHSMEPRLYTGDLAIVRKQREYAVGDVIAFQVEGGVVIHRIVGGNARDGYTTRGDNRETTDLWRPKPSNVGGKMVLHVPKLGLAISAARRRQNLPVLAAFLGVLFVLTGGRKPQLQRDSYR